MIQNKNTKKEKKLRRTRAKHRDFDYFILDQYANRHTTEHFVFIDSRIRALARTNNFITTRMQRNWAILYEP